MKCSWRSDRGPRHGRPLRAAVRSRPDGGPGRRAGSGPVLNARSWSTPARAHRAVSSAQRCDLQMSRSPQPVRRLSHRRRWCHRPLSCRGLVGPGTRTDRVVTGAGQPPPGRRNQQVRVVARPRARDRQRRDTVATHRKAAPLRPKTDTHAARITSPVAWTLAPMPSGSTDRPSPASQLADQESLFPFHALAIRPGPPKNNNQYG